MQLKNVENSDKIIKRERDLIKSMPGGIAIYRLKKNGKVATDYVSESLAKMCGYTADEFLDYLREDGLVNLLPADIDEVMENVSHALMENKPISVRYHIYTKAKEPIFIRLDANIIESEELGPDDHAVLYAMHTIVSDDSKRIIEDQHQLHELMNKVPGGIGVFEVKDGKFNMSYINDSYYTMMGTTREDRAQYDGVSALGVIHPDDLPLVQDAINRLVHGEEKSKATYRAIDSGNNWKWIHIVGSVAQRKENYIRIYGSLSDYTDVMRARHEIETSRVTLKVALDIAKVMSWRYNYKAKQITDSGTLGEINGLPKVIDNVPDVLISKGFVYKDSIEAFLDLYKRLPSEKREEESFLSTVESDNGLRWYKMIFTPTFDMDGNYVDHVGVAIDITDQKVREENYEEKLQLSRAATQDALSTVSFNITRNQITAFDWKTLEFEHHSKFKTADELLSSVREDFKNTDEIEKFEIVKDCEAMKKAFKKGENHIEIISHLMGSTTWVKTTYDMVENPHTGDIEVISSIYDVTDNVRSELVVNRLKDVDYQSIVIIDSETGAVQPFDRDTVDTQLEEIKQLKNEEDVSNGLNQFLRDFAVDETAEQAIIENSLEVVKSKLEERDYYETLYSIEKNGKIQHIRNLYTYLEDKNTGAILCAVQNVTETFEEEHRQRRELSKALAAAEDANVAKTSFLSRVSHDMRTPLNGILGITSLLKSRLHKEENINDLRDLELSGKYLLNLINDTLDVSRIESGKLELHPSVCDGRTLVDNAITLAKANMKEKNLTLNINLEPLDYKMLYIDSGRIEQVCMNVLGNAIKFTPEGGEISLTVKKVGEGDNSITEEFIIEDTGIGMSKEFIDHIFEPFSQEDATRTSLYEGTGLGMAITRSILTLMGGNIEIESEIGKGTKVTLTLPLELATEEQVELWQREEIVDTDTSVLRGKRVLLCEDHPLNAKIAIRLLNAKDINVEHAENGSVGLSMFKDSKPGYFDAILMDIRMPVMDGLEAARKIRELPRRDARFIPIIAMTANALDQDITQTRNAGMDAHLSKPIVTEVMYDTLEKFLCKTTDQIKKSILIVDDSEINRAVLIASLEMDYDLVEANNGKEALEILEQNDEIDGLITDIQMPEMDGIQLIEYIKENNLYEHLAIIANTQFGDADQEEYLINLGVDDFIYKPTNPRVVEMRVRNVLRAYR